MITHEEARATISKNYTYGLTHEDYLSLLNYVSQQENLENEHEALKRDVARYFELVDKDEVWTIEDIKEFSKLKEKLSKAGKEE